MARFSVFTVGFISLFLTLAVAWADTGNFPGNQTRNSQLTRTAEPAVSEEQPFQHRKVQLPGWVTRIPENCFVGISLPSNSIQEARTGALDSAVSQVLSAMGAEYDLEYRSVATGTMSRRGGSSYVAGAGSSVKVQHEINERLSYTARWFMESIQRNVRRTEVVTQNGRYIGFLLVECPENELERLRKLTMGPKVTARVVRRTTDGLDIELTETNGVKATFTSYTATVETRNRNAQMITLFAWKVPESHTRKTRGGIQNGIVVKSGSKRFTIPAMNPETGGFKAAILRADSRLSLTLEGYDEIGRPVSISVAGLRQHFRCSCRDVPLIKTPFLIDE